MEGRAEKKGWGARRRVAVVAYDALMIPVAWYLAYWLRFNLDAIPTNFLRTAAIMLPVVIPCQLFSYMVFGLYRGSWRFASLPDFIRIGKSVYMGALLAALAIFFITGMEEVPRAVLPLYALLLFGLLGGSRALYQYLKSRHLAGDGRRVLIIGAGESAGMLTRDMMRNGGGPYLPIGMIDDDPSKRGLEIHGVRVLGAFEDIPGLVKQHAVELIIIAIPSLSSNRMKRLVAICEGVGTPFRTLPKLEDLIAGRVTADIVREVSIEDLLGRERVELDQALMQAGLSGKTIMVTGGGGSIGAELCRQVAKFAPAALIIYERNEFNLYRVQQELEQRFPQVRATAVLGDVCDQAAIEGIVEERRPGVIFHAAAYKQVPLLQAYPAEAVRNNVIGTKVVADAASRFDCGKFVFISTDKAVNPANVLGATKRAGELYCEGMNAVSATRFVTVRFGNVLGSDGSVVPLFREQIQAGGPVTVTHPDIVRYFMTIREACQLILQASVMEGSGGIFVLDMGEPVKIMYLAEQMILLSGKEPGKDIEIRRIGLRPGEKLSEELFYDNEQKETTENAKILKAKHAPTDRDEIQQAVARLEHSLAGSSDAEIKSLLTEIAPHSQP